MPFKKGQPKIGGRKANTPNKRSARDLQQICEDLGVDPFTEMLKLAQSSRDEGIKVACYRECSKYLYVQKRAQEITGPIEVESSEVKEILADLKGIIDTKLNERKA
jgi:hypothetical protein